MGVHELWQVLEPVKQHVPLESLAGKTLAVDLSIWVCEAQHVKQMIGVVNKPHLRNLFFRVSSLSQMGVKLVFVTEGEPPKIKADTMNKRTEMRFGPSNKPAPSRPGRSYFKTVLKECLRMLDCLGVPWVQAAGEAEAMCAYLDARGHVDGCITNDGDVFLYGAKTVFRNFTLNSKDPYLDCYASSDIKEKLGLDRESLVSLAILLGCDYVPKGLPGIGREMAMKFIKSLNGESALQRFSQWSKQFGDQAANPKAAKKTAHCSVCCHPGSAKEHTRKGCSLCGSEQYCQPHDYDYQCPCVWHKAEQEKKNNPLDYTMKMKAKKREGFPYPEVIKEFLENKDNLTKVIKWRRPSLQCFQNYAQEKIEWPKHYSSEKVIILLTYYDMHERKAGKKNDAQLQAIRILKTRVRNGVPCYEIEWVKPEGYVFPDDHPPDAPLLTIEEETLFTDAYPHIVDLFQKEKMEAELLKLKSKKSKPKPKAPPSVDDVASLLSDMCLAPAEEKSPLLPMSDVDVEPLPSSIDVEPIPSSIDVEPLPSSIDVEPLPSSSLESPDDPHEIVVPVVQSTLQLVVETSPNSSSIEKDFNASTSFLFDGDDPENEGQCSSPVQTDRREPTVSSPNISSVISDLHLSDIDWDSTSFCQSPQMESRTHNTESISKDKPRSLEPSNKVRSLANVKQEKPSMQILKEEINISTTKTADTRFISNIEKLPLRERILLKNASQYEHMNSQKNLPSSHLGSDKEILPSVRLGSDKEILPSVRLGSNKEILTSTRPVSGKENLPSVRLGSDKEILPLVRLGSDKEILPLVRLGSEKEFLPSVHLGSDKENLSSARLGSNKEILTSARPVSGKEILPSVRLGSEKEFLPSVRLGSDKEILPSVRLGSDKENLPSARLISSKENLPSVCLVSDKEKPKQHASSKHCTNFKENVEIHPKILRPPCPQNAAVSKPLGANANAQAPQRPPTKSFSFVKKTTLVPTRNSSDSSLTNKPKSEVKLMPVKSVCQKISMSSEEEAVNCKNKHAIKSIVLDIIKDDPSDKMLACLPKTSPVSVLVSDFDRDVFSSPKCRTVGKNFSKDEQSDCDDSIVSVDSPLPLSERLKLRLLQS